MSPWRSGRKRDRFREDQKRARESGSFPYLVTTVVATPTDERHSSALRAVEMLGLPASRERALKAERLHALLDGLALHGAMRPERLPPRRIVAVLSRHLDELEGKA